MNRPVMNLKKQEYKGVPLFLINRNYTGYNAMRFMLGSRTSGQNIWIPNCYLQEDGTLKTNINIDFIFKKAYWQKKFEYAKINVNPLLW